jgi:hypothetical protein
MDMGIITLCFVEGFLSFYPYWPCPHRYEGNHVQLNSGYYGVDVYVFRLPFGCCVFSRVMVVGLHLVVGLFLWYWHQQILEVSYRVAIMPRCMLYGYWRYKLCLRSAFPLALL